MKTHAEIVEAWAEQIEAALRAGSRARLLAALAGWVAARALARAARTRAPFVLDAVWEVAS